MERLGIVWTGRALADLERIGEFISADDPEAAARWIGRLIGTVERAALVPSAGRRVPEVRRDDIREHLLRTYRVVYRMLPSAIEVLTLFEGHRRFPDDLDLDGTD